VLEEILQDKRAEVAKLNAATLRNVRPSSRDLGIAIGTGRQGLSLVIEVKRRDPFEGDVRPDLDLARTSAELEALGVAALVVATESRYWGGSRNDLVELDRRVQVPLLRHDFIFDELQLYESRRAGADAVLLRPALVQPPVLHGFLRTLASMHMSGVVLVHDRAELDAALEAGAHWIAVSNRDPVSGAIDLGRTLGLAPHVPASCALLSLFGIRTAADVARLQGRVDAIGLGTALLRAADPVAFLHQLAAGPDGPPAEGRP
jgi:indole-3-glycerol phosphate synthase